MTLAVICGWTLARAGLLCLLAWPVCRWIERAYAMLSVSWRPWLLAGLIAPACFPELLVGYAFRDLAVARPDLAEGLCSLLLLVRIIPVGTIALLATPRSGPDASAVYCRLLLVRSAVRTRNDWYQLLRCYWHRDLLRALPALGLMGIVAFQEFELAALLQTISWTDWFIAARWQGLERQEMLKQSFLPLLWQLPIVIGAMVWVRRASIHLAEGPGIDDGTERPEVSRVVWGGVVVVAVTIVVGCLIPLGLMGWRTIDGFALLARQRTQQFGLAREILISSAVATCAAGLAWGISGRLRGICLNLLFAGLFGSLLLSLGAVAIFQWPWLRPIYDTPIPWVVVLTVWLLPRAALLRAWLHACRNDAGIHVAEMICASNQGRSDVVYASQPREPQEDTASPRTPKQWHRWGNTIRTLLLRSSRRGRQWSRQEDTASPRTPKQWHLGRRDRKRSLLLWHLRDQPQFLAASLLCYWAYCDLPSACMLAPSGMASGLVRLYNFMHFGRSAALSAESLVFFSFPVICWFVLVRVGRRVWGGDDVPAMDEHENSLD